MGYGGVEGAFSEDALIKYFGDKVKKVNYEQFEWVFEALKEDKIDYGVL
ncbi:prephenate dehydratase domain-containing protein, partial [Clostridium sp.]